MVKSIMWGIVGIVGYGLLVLVVSPRGQIQGLNVGAFVAMLATWGAMAAYVLVMRIRRRR